MFIHTYRYDALKPWVNYAPFYVDNVTDILQVRVDTACTCCLLLTLPIYDLG